MFNILSVTMTVIKEDIRNRENECNEIPIFRNKNAMETFKINKDQIDWERPPENLSCRHEKKKISTRQAAYRMIPPIRVQMGTD